MPTPRVITVTLNPAIDMKMLFQEPRLESLNRARSVYLEPSGKGVNVSRALAAQGITASTIVPLGGAFGRMIQEALVDSGVPLLAVPIAGESRCNVKVIDVQTGASTEFNAPGAPITPDELEDLRATLREIVRADDLVVFSGSVPANLHAHTYSWLIEEVQALGARAILDADRDALREGLRARPYLVKPNRHEAEELLGMTIDSDDQALQAARLIQLYGVQHVVLSLGASGAVFVSPSEALRVVPAPVRPRGTVGSGDALLAGVICGLVRGWSWAVGARYATALAVARTQIDGIGFPGQAEVEGYLEAVELVPLP